MARLWSTGFELQSIADGIEFHSSLGTVGGSGHSISTAIKRTGEASFRCNPSGVATCFFAQDYTADDQIYIRAYLRIASAPDAATKILELAGGGTEIVAIVLNTDRTLQAISVLDSNSNIGSASSALSVDTWYRIEWFVDTTTTTWTVTGKIDGVNFVSTTFSSSGSGTLDTFLIGALKVTAGNHSCDLYFDDVAINNTLGSFQTSFPGAGGIVHLKPNAAGDTDEWDLTTTYEDIDETTPDDATTIITSLTSGQTHEVNLEATPAAIGSGDTINCVQVGVRFNESVGTDPDPTFVLRIKASASGTVEESGSITANSTSWSTHNVTAPRLPQLTLYDLPGASTTAYTKADLDTTQIGVRLTNSPVGLAQVSTMWLLVDFTPAVATTTSTSSSTSTTTSSSTSTSTTSTSSSTSTTTSSSTSTSTTSTSSSTSTTTSSSTSTSTTSTSSSTSTTTSSSTSTTSTSSSTSTTTSTSTSTSTTSTSSSTSTTTSSSTSTSTTSTSSSTSTTTSTSTSTSTTSTSSSTSTTTSSSTSTSTTSTSSSTSTTTSSSTSTSTTSTSSSTSTTTSSSTSSSTTSTSSSTSTTTSSSTSTTSTSSSTSTTTSSSTSTSTTSTSSSTSTTTSTSTSTSTTSTSTSTSTTTSSSTSTSTTSTSSSTSTTTSTSTSTSTSSSTSSSSSTSTSTTITWPYPFAVDHTNDMSHMSFEVDRKNE